MPLYLLCMSEPVYLRRGKRFLGGVERLPEAPKWKELSRIMHHFRAFCRGSSLKLEVKLRQLLPQRHIHSTGGFPPGEFVARFLSPWKKFSLAPNPCITWNVIFSLKKEVGPVEKLLWMQMFFLYKTEFVTSIPRALFRKSLR